MINDKFQEISDKLSNSGKSGVEYIKNITINTTKESPLLGIIIFLILGIVALLFINYLTHSIVGFLRTPMGTLVLFMFIGAIGIYIYLRSLGLKLNGWVGALVEISLLFIGIYLFIGANNMLAGFFMSVMPIVVIGAIIYFFWKGISQIKDKGIRDFSIGMAILFIIAIIIGNVFLVPVIYGDQQLLEVDLTNTGRPSTPLEATIRLYHPYSTMVLTNGINPYIVGSYQISNYLWVLKYKEYILDVKVIDVANNYKELYYSVNNYIYIKDKPHQTGSFYTVIVFPPQEKQYFDYLIEIWVYNSNHQLVLTQTYHYYGYSGE